MAEFESTGPVWMVRLDNEEAETLSAMLNALAPWTEAMGPLGPVIKETMAASAEHISLMNKLGGHNGVDVHGVAGSQGIIVTPRASGLYEKLRQGASAGVAAGTVAEWLLAFAAQQPALQSSLGLSTAAEIFRLVAGGTPFQWAVLGAVGGLVLLIFEDDDESEPGGILADRGDIGPWERFLISHHGADNTVALLSWQGFFSARNGGGGAVYGNRPWVGSWEKWRLIDNHDGTVSLQALGGHYFVAEDGGGRECWANRTAIGPWEKFYLRPQPDGYVALQTRNKWKYVSVQGHGVPVVAQQTQRPTALVSQQHVFYRGTDGAINHIFYDKRANKLFHDRWTSITGAPLAAGDPAALIFSNPNQQHVFYRGADGAINHIFYDQPTNKLYHDQWTALSKAPDALGDPATMATPGQQHIFYRGEDGAIDHIFWDQATNKLHHDQWTVMTEAPAAAGDPATMVTPGQEHIFYRGRDGAIDHIFWDQATNKLYHDQWTARTQSPPAAGDPATMVTPGQQHVFYRLADGSIHHIFYDQHTNQLYSDNWTAKTQAPPAAGDPSTLVTPGQQHLFYRAADGAIHHIFYDHHTNQFYRDTWTAMTQAAPAGGDPATLFFPDPHQQHIFYRGGDGAVNHIFYDQPTNKLYHDRWTDRVNAPPARGEPCTMGSS